MKQDLIVNSILEEQVKQQSNEYTERLETGDSGKENISNAGRELEELKQDLIVNSILQEQVKQQSNEYTERLETLEIQVEKTLAMQVEN